MAARGDGTSTARAYAREIERTIERLSGRPVVFSHRDWDLARRWHDDGVPLGMVLELLQDKGARAARGLRSIAAAVEAAWSVVRSGEIRAEPAPVTSVRPSDTHEDPYLAAAGKVAGEALAGLLRDASERLRRGESRPAIDRDVDRALPGACPAGWIEDAEQIVAGRLAPYHGRLPPVELERVQERARIDALRARAGLPPTATTRADRRIR